MIDEDEVLVGEVIEPSATRHTAALRRVADSLPAAEGAFRTLWWQGIRFSSLRKAMERYESAVRGAAAVERAHGDLVDAHITHNRARHRLGDLENILNADSRERRRQWNLAQLRDEKEEEDLRLDIARARRAREQLARSPDKSRKEKRRDTDYAALLNTIVTRRKTLKEAEREAIADILKDAGVEREEDLSEDADVRGDVENIRDIVRNLLSRQWHEPEEGSVS